MNMPQIRDDMVKLAQVIWVSTLEIIRKRKYEEMRLKGVGAPKTLNKKPHSVEGD